MKKKLQYALFCLAATSIFSSRESKAQLTITGQMRTRTEYRDGQGTLPDRGQTPSIFTSQRTRLNIGFTGDHLRLFTAIQDVRVWGMDASTISNMDGNRLFLHEGWGEIIFNDSTYFKKLNNFSLKIGRQEIMYDDSRLLGNLDWLQQARRHDAAVLKFNKGTLWVDAGFAFNQNREKKNTGNIYNGTALPQLGTDGINVASPAGTNAIGTMYKTMQYLYVAKEISFTRLTLLVFKDDFQRSSTTPNATPGGPAITTFNKGIYSRVTSGLAIYNTILRKHKIDLYGYYQGDRDKSGKTLDAYMAGINGSFAIGRKVMLGPGVDYLSGNNSNKSTNVNHRFDPLYGTPHKFWGYMDYFYVADPYGVNGSNALSPGLVNLFFKTKYKLRDNLTANLDIHEFYAGNTVANISTPETDDQLDKRLGTEFDFVLQYALTKQVVIEGGYSLMLGTGTLDKLKLTGAGAANVDKRNNGNWAYLMVSIRPDLLAPIMDKLKQLTGQINTLNQQVTDLNNK